MKSTILLLIALSLACLVLAGCSGDKAPQPTSDVVIDRTANEDK